MTTTPLRDFLEIPYDKLEEMNLEVKRERLERIPAEAAQERRRKYLADEPRIKAVTVCFSDLEGRFHMLDYDKKFLLKSADHLTFDGSSIRGFSQQDESEAPQWEREREVASLEYHGAVLEQKLEHASARPLAWDIRPRIIRRYPEGTRQIAST